MFRSFISQLRGSIWWYFYPSSVSGKYFPVIPGPCQLLGPPMPCYPGTVHHGPQVPYMILKLTMCPSNQHPGLRSEGAECGICTQAAPRHNILMRQMSMFVHFPAAL